jgi:hypothetical protein
MRILSIARRVLPPAAILLGAACDSSRTFSLTNPDTTSTTGPSRVYVQVDRLGNPLVSEVFFPKRDHGLHNSTAPSTDVANNFAAKIKAFTDAFNRSATIGNTLGAALVPDMLTVFPNRDAASAAWLSWALSNGYGGRKLSDDVVDAGLNAIFGRLLDPTATVVAGLTTDNVSTSVRSFSTTFPYLEPSR